MTGSRVLIRSATAADLPADDDLHTASGRSSWSAGVLDRAAAGAVCALVAVLDGAVVGAAKTHEYATADSVAPAGHYLGGVTVHPGVRRMGCGTALTRARLAWIWERSDTAYYVANENNVASVRMHRPLGFEEIGRARHIHGVTADDEGVSLVLFRARRAAGPFSLRWRD
jgi:aminoglycoside 6'-N-acetyltransferase I